MRELTDMFEKVSCKERKRTNTNISNNLILTLCQCLLNLIQLVGKGKNPAENSRVIKDALSDLQQIRI